MNGSRLNFCIQPTILFFLSLLMEKEYNTIFIIKPLALKWNNTITSKVGQFDYFFEDSIAVTLCLFPSTILYTYTAVYCAFMISILLDMKFKTIYVIAIIKYHVFCWLIF